METKVKRREWVKTAAIVLLSVLLVLTFFSNTIMNHSLPEVAAQYVESGSINARIRGNGTVSANEVYEVTLAQTRKVQSVLVKVGQEVTAGDPLFILESMDSEELRAAQEQLEQMELDYQKSLMSMSNDSSTEDRGIQKLREEYEEALRLYRVYTNMNPDDIELSLKQAEEDLRTMQQQLTELQKKLEIAREEVAEAEAKITEAEANIDELVASLNTSIFGLDSVSIEKKQAELKNVVKDLQNAEMDYQEAVDELNKYKKGKPTYQAFGYETNENLYDFFNELTKKVQHRVQDFLLEPEQFREYVLKTTTYNSDFFTSDYAIAIVESYSTIVSMQNYLAKMSENVLKRAAAENDIAILDSILVELYKIEKATESISSDYTAFEDLVVSMETEISNQQAYIENLNSANTAADRLKSAEEALEDAIFESNLGNTQNLDMEKARKDIEKQKELIEELSQEADGKEIAANVSGVISAIHVTAGNTAGAEQPIAEITVADRGYTVNITVTTDQARQVRIGDTAQVTNYYWGDISATLENIANDPQSMGQNKVLIFRINGEGVEAGTNLSLSIGQKSANYDCLVPNSAIRSDSNGSFVLVVTSKSSPLGNRYHAARVEVQVLASDDTTSAVTGLSNGDFVITTSNKPLEAGDMIRLPDNG